MKKIYSIIAAAAIGSMVSASAFTTIDKIEKNPGKNLRNLEIEQLKATHPQQLASLSGEQSRAEDEVIDITKFTQQLYFDYFFNWYEDVPGSTAQEKLESFRNIRSSNEIEIADNNDGTFSIKGFGGYNVFNPTMYITEEGGLEMHMGEVLYQDDSFTYVLAAIDNENDIQLYNGETIPVTIYKNALEPEIDFIGVLAMQNGTPKAWPFLSVMELFIEPNATLTYTRTTTDQEGNETVTDINNRVYVEFQEANPNADPGSVYADDHFMVSNVTPFNSGVSVYFTVAGDLIYALDAIAIASETLDDRTNTGNYYMSTLWIEGNNLVYDNVMIINSPSETELIWPCTYEGLLEKADFWSIMAETGYWAGQLGNATLTIDSDEDPEDPNDPNGGISDISSDNAPSVYYNLQGMQVTNPATGQIYIVKNGNKVSKVIK